MYIPRPYIIWDFSSGGAAWFYFYPNQFLGERGLSTPLETPEPLSVILNPNNFVPKNGFPVVKGVKLPKLRSSVLKKKVHPSIVARTRKKRVPKEPPPWSGNGPPYLFGRCFLTGDQSKQDLERHFFFFIFTFFLISHIYFPASGQAVVTGVVPPFPPPPRFLPSIFIAHRVLSNPTLLVDFPSSVVANSRSRAFRESISPNEVIRVCTRRGLELTKLTYTRLEDNLVRHRGDRPLTHTKPHVFLPTYLQTILVLITMVSTLWHFWPPKNFFLGHEPSGRQIP